MRTQDSQKLCRVVSADGLRAIQAALSQMAATQAPEVWRLTEADLGDERSPLRRFPIFQVVVSSAFSGLLLARASEPAGAADAARYVVELTFDPLAIAQFLQLLQPNLAVTLPWLATAQRHLQPNQPELQTEFTLQLVDVLAALPQPVKSPVPPPVAPTQTVFPAHLPHLAPLRQADLPTAQQELLHQVVSQIRHRLNLADILTAALEQVRQLLNADRVVIYEFDPDVFEHEPVPTAHLLEPNQAVYGRISYETRVDDAIPSVLYWTEGMQCFINLPDLREKYRKDTIVAIADIHQTFAHAPCLVQMLERAQVQSELVVPIVLQDELWGLLIAHQCRRQRDWQPSEQAFLLCIAEHMAIAIHQAVLNEQLKQKQAHLEEQVRDRTRALRDTLDAVQTANAAKSEFLASMSHELRTPLTCIIGMAATLMRLHSSSEQISPLPPEKQHEYLRTIRASGEHLLDLINDILDLSRLEAGRLVLQVEEFSLSRLAIDCLRMLQEKARQRDIHLHQEIRLKPIYPGIDALRGDEFLGDPRRIKQILVNLLSNAVKFTPAGGDVTLRVWSENGKAVFQVEDTGIGIPADKINLLFEKFQQLDQARNRQYEGTGLGLAVTKQLVDLHGGSIDVASREGQGSIFTIWLSPQSPAVAAAPLPVSPSSPRDRPSPSGRLLLVEQDEETATTLCNLLNTAGYQVVWAMDGSAALQQFEILQPLAILVSTHQMGRDANDILAQLSDYPPAQASPVMVLENGTVPYPATHWEKLGASYLPVPTEQPEALLTALSDLADRAASPPVNRAAPTPDAAAN